MTLENLVGVFSIVGVVCTIIGTFIAIQGWQKERKKPPGAQNKNVQAALPAEWNARQKNTLDGAETATKSDLLRSLILRRMRLIGFIFLAVAILSGTGCFLLNLVNNEMELSEQEPIVLLGIAVLGWFAAYGIIMWALFLIYPKQRLQRKIDRFVAHRHYMAVNRVVVLENFARFWGNTGWLFLTDTALVFLYSNFRLLNQRIEIPLNQILNATSYNYSCITVTRTNSKRIRFYTDMGRAWVEEITQRLSSK